jgi:DNA (cytosine-5)-methyltransferase 1
MPHILDKTIVAMRGRNHNNPSDRTVGSPTEQRLEPNSKGICNTLTSVQKDNLVMETVRIKQATSQGYIECEVGGVADLSFPESKTRRGRVQENGQVSPTLMAGEQDICRIETYSPYVNQKYQEFQEENGYIPEYFNPYNKTELTDVAPTLTAQGESVTKSSTVLKCDTQYRIRKLTPRECWRLMDFTDEDFEKAAQVNSNTQLYRQAGNSICKNVLVAIFGQMLEGREDAYRKL